mgnify:FL=1
MAEGAMLNFSISTLASICIHTGLLIGCALFTWGGGDVNLGDDGTEVTIAILPSENLIDRPEELLDAEEVEDAHCEPDELNEAELQIDGPASGVGDVGIDSELSLLAPSGSSGGGGMPAIGTISGGGGALDGQATFMGIQAQGRRFCIIADRSGSMFGTKFEYLKEEILATMDGMRGHTRLQIILFNTRATRYPEEEWFPPRGERDAVKVWLDGLVADGDTYPTPAFVQAFEMKPLPDAIFFMTDGRFDGRVVNQIMRLNKKSQRTVPVHTITFVDRSAATMMQKIADDSGGKYRHVDGTSKRTAAIP